VNENNLPIIAGIDEVGRGCLAGPVVASAVVLPNKFDLPHLRDSKKLTPKQREFLEIRIKETAIAWAIGLATHREIDSINILQASLLAMKRAFCRLSIRPDLVYVDGIHAPHIDVHLICVKRGDDLVPQISAASILAKTYRDNIMKKLDKNFPGYGFAIHKGYATRYHLEKLKAMGPSRIHRKSFKGVKELIELRHCQLTLKDYYTG